MNPLIHNSITVLNSLGRAFCDYAGSMFVQSGVLIVLLLFVDFMIRKRVRATLRYWVWMLVFVKLLLPPSLSLPTGLGYWRGDILSAAVPVLEQKPIPVQHNPVELPVLEDTPLSAEIPQFQPPQTTPVPTGPASPIVSHLNTLTWQAVVFALWCVGVLVFSALLIQKILYIRRLIARREPAENRCAEMLNQCREPVNIRRPIELRLSNNVFSPAVCGVFKPVILMPTALIEKLQPDRLRAVLIHELCHIKRGDLWINSAQTILQIIYFYNPLVWLANVLVRRIREQAVDEMVLVTLGTGAKDYSNTLIDIAEKAFLKTSLSLRLIGVVESKKALEGRIRHMFNRPIPKNVKLGILGLTTVLIFGAVLLPMARAQKQSTDDTSTVLDLDKDGLENEFEAELGTNPKSTDTDGDGLSDYDEYCKYRTDPTKKDSDGDGKPDGNWQERREYAYSIRAICEIRSPSSLEMINDLYQDARPIEKKATLDDAKVVEVLIFPFATAHVYPQPFPKERLDSKSKQYVQPTASMNFSSKMKEDITNIVHGAATDVEAIEKMLRWMNGETSLVREMPHWEYLYIIDGDIVWHQSLGSSERDKQFLETNFLGDSMFKNKVHGTCSSTAILRGTMFRAAGLPTRLIQTLPLMTRYSEDPEPLADQLRMRAMAKGYDWGPGNGGANHTYNEVFLNNRWVRVDNSIGTSPFVGDKLFVKAWSAPSWNNLKEEWNDKRCFRATHVSDAYPKYKSESAKMDIAIEDEDLTVTRQSDGRFTAGIRIHNKGSLPSPQFRVHFYAGDPDEGGRLLSRNNSGPIMPGGDWGEGTYPFQLDSGEDTVSVVVDVLNIVDESDETNNKATQKIPGRVKKEGFKPSHEPSGSGSKPNIFITSPSNFEMFREIFDMVKDVTSNKTGRYHNKRSYDEIFIDEIHNKKPGDIIVLLFLLDSTDRIPTEYGDLLPRPWPEIEAVLKQGKTVELKGEARELNVILLAAPTNQQLRLLVQESTLLNPSAKPSQSRVPTSGFTATLPDGVTVELVGVCEHPSEGKQWWRPDGTHMENAPYKSMGSRLKHHEGYNDYEFVMRLTGPSDTSYKWEVPGGRQGSDTGAPIDKDGNWVSDLRVYTANQSQDKKTASVHIGVTAAKWETLATHVPKDGEETYSLKDGAIAFGVPYEKDGKTLLPVVHNFNRGHNTVAIRVIAITHSDEQLGSSCSGSGGNILSSLTYGFDLPLDNIREFRFETRPYTWIEFQNVSLQPGMKANVKSRVLQGDLTFADVP